jgi:7-cyano-7-deazaguanine synthase in queuosine biosynthesis
MNQVSKLALNKDVKITFPLMGWSKQMVWDMLTVYGITEKDVWSGYKIA